MPLSYLKPESVGLLFALNHRSSCAMVWLVNELDITNDGWPVAQPRFMSRPSASTRMLLPDFLKTNSSYWALMLTRSTTPALVEAYSAAMSISLSKCPMFATIALSFIRFM